MRFLGRRKPTPPGTAAREQAEARLEEAKDLWPEVVRVSKSLRELRMQNGFAEQIRLAMGVREK